jgi:predicted alpha-1,2-mannosidase
MKRILLFLLVPSVLAGQSPVSYVDPLVGTGPARTISSLKHSESVSEDKGQTFPAVGRPFGMTQWTPETRTTEIKCISPYYYSDSRITGFRGSHWMSGSCTQDYGSVTLMPFTAIRPDTVKSLPSSTFSHDNEFANPAYYSVILNDYGIMAELTGSVRSGMLRFSFPGDKVSCIIIRPNSDEKEGRVWYDTKTNEIAGYNPVHRIYQGRGSSAGFSGYFVIKFDKPFRVISKGNDLQSMVISFGSEKNITVCIGTSFTGLSAARNNLNTEIPDWNFDRIRNETEKVWNETLGKIQVKGGTEEELTKFYTALYHCYQLPRIASDIDGSYQGFAQDTLIRKAIGFDYYDDFSMWDTYRALHPLLTILEPERTRDMLRSLLLKAQQGGWMPIFPAWGSYTAAMIGDHVSTTIADAFMKGITDFDAEQAYKYMRQNAFDSPSRDEYIDGKGRRALKSYLQYGYIPLEDSVWDAFHRREQVSRTLEYAFDDYALSRFAKAIGKTDDSRILLKRSANWMNVFDKNTGYVRGRFANGSWIEPFNPYAKASYICEGTPFQYTWYVPHDIPGLVKAMGGKDIFLKRLNEFFDNNHYWHGNETDHQAAYIFTMAGLPSKTQEWVSKIVKEEYGTGPGGLSGNEDAGQMSAWLVFSMMGFFPVCPASNQYVITTPAFDEIKISLPGKRFFTMSTSGRGSVNNYISSVTRDKKSYKDWFIKHEDIAGGANFELQLTNILQNK